ncbi:MAG: hypothetical protein IPK19_24585 [Chloroflexi bacterium]|nr:hypothetical protein [Chloroflexota bacterium]
MDEADEEQRGQAEGDATAGDLDQEERLDIPSGEFGIMRMADAPGAGGEITDEGGDETGSAPS